MTDKNTPNSAALDALNSIPDHALTKEKYDLIYTAMGFPVNAALTKEAAQPEVDDDVYMPELELYAVNIPNFVQEIKDWLPISDLKAWTIFAERMADNYPNGLIIRAAQQNMGDAVTREDTGEDCHKVHGASDSVALCSPTTTDNASTLDDVLDVNSYFLFCLGIFKEKLSKKIGTNLHIHNIEPVHLNALIEGIETLIRAATKGEKN